MNGITLEELKVIIEAETKPFRDELAKIQHEIKKTTDSVNQSTSKIKTAFAGIKKFLIGLGITSAMYKIGKSSISMAAQVESSTQQVNRLMGESAEAFMRWGRQNALSLNMSQSDFAKYSATYGNLLSSFISSTSGVAKQTTELLKASAIIQSATGRTMEDVMERIRSGLLGNTEAIEDLGINVNVAMLESTEAFKKFAGDKSWNQLDFKTQQQIRLMAILEQTSNKFGNSVQKNTNSSLAMLSAISKDVVLNIGNALLPALNAILPVFINIAMAVRTATSYLATFMQLLFNYKKGTSETNALTKSQNAFNNSLDKTAESAKKASKAMGGLMAFDELNVISSSSSAASGGSAGNKSSASMDSGFGNDLFVEEPDTSGIQKAVEKVKGFIEGIKNIIQKNKVPINSALAGITAAFAVFTGMKWFKGIEGITGILVKMLDLPGAQKTATTFLNIYRAIPEKISGIFSSILKMPGVKGLSSGLITIFSNATSAVSGFAGPLINKFITPISQAFSLVTGSVQSLITSVMNMPIIGPILTQITGFFSKSFGAISGFLTNTLGIIVSSPALLAIAIAAIIAAIVQLWQTNDDFKENLITAWENIKTTLKTLWETIIKPIFDAIVDICISVWENGLKPLWDAWIYLVDVIVTVIANLWNNVSPIFNELLRVLGPVFKNVLSALTVFVSTAFNLVLNAISLAMTLGSGAIDGFFATVDEVFGGIEKILSGIIDVIKGVFTGDWERVWQGVIDIFDGIFQSIAGIVKQPINAVIGIINGAIDKINGFGFNVPDWVPIIGGKSFKVNVKKLQYLAEGAVVDHATPAIFGEKGAEAVIPLERNTGGIKKIANRISEYIGSTNNEVIEEMLMMIIDIIQDFEFDRPIYLDGEEVTKRINRINKRMDLRKG